MRFSTLRPDERMNVLMHFALVQVIGCSVPSCAWCAKK